MNLLPCPFCGGPASLHKLSDVAWQIECGNDDPCLVCVDVRGPLAEIVTAWNTRAKPAEPPEDQGDDRLGERGGK